MNSQPTPDSEPERLFPLSVLNATLPAPVSRKTLYMWRTKGIQGVILNCVQQAGRFFSTKKDLDAFLSACADAKSQRQAQ